MRTCCHRRITENCEKYYDINDWLNINDAHVLQFGPKAAEAIRAKDGEFNQSCKGMMKSLAEKYDNVVNIDKLTAVKIQVDSVKLEMHKNIENAIKNCVKMELIEEDTGHKQFCHKFCLLVKYACLAKLLENTKIFKKNAFDLKNKMWWKSMKVINSTTIMKNKYYNVQYMCR